MTKQKLTQYEEGQQFNRITAWLHGFRYKHVHDVFSSLSDTMGGRSIKVLEIGCASAKLFGLLSRRFDIDYYGVDVSAECLDAANERYGVEDNFRIALGSATELNVLTANGVPDVIVALETLEHIPEHDVVRIVENIGQLKPQLFICSVPVEVGPAVWLKNVGSLMAGYSRHTEYTWPETFYAGLYKLDKLPPHGTGHKGFDWRWLAQTIRHNMAIRETRRFPVGVLPAALSTSVFFVAEPRS